MNLLHELLEFQIAKTGLEYHDTLNPAIWNEDQIKPDLIQKLKDLATAYFKYLKLQEAVVKDVIITGSNANYNWSEFSDLDLHVVVDLKEVYAKNEKALVTNYLQRSKRYWGTLHHIVINGVPVELYAQPIEDHLDAGGVYSLMTQTWSVHPTQVRVELNSPEVIAKAGELMDQIDSLEDSVDMHQLAKFRAKLKRMRQEGLDKGGEFDPENQIFKVLRNNGYLDKLNNLFYKSYDQRFE